MMNRVVHGQSLDPTFSDVLLENWKELFPEHDDLSFEEFRSEQECFYESYQTNGRNSGGTSDHGQSNNLSPLSGQEGESSQRRSIELLSYLDEDFARSLQLGDDLDGISEFLGNGAGSTEGSSRGTPVSSRGTPARSRSPDMRQDEVNPDEMTYEQLQSLGDSIGTESKGLSDEFISRLPYYKYKKGFLSQREECVICVTKCKDGEYLTTLPCAHHYHLECITPWLKLNKTCPVCKEEVRDS